MPPAVELLPAFVLLAVVGHLLVPPRTQNLWLLAVSGVFYAWWDWRLLGLLAVLLLVNFWLVRAMAAAVGRRRQVLVGGCLGLDLAVLAAFKYLGFFVHEAAALLRAPNVTSGEPVQRLVVPLGLSFLTFQLVAYAVDVYYQRLEACGELGTFLLFGFYFPQITAGPIPRAGQLLPQLALPRRPTWEQWPQGGVLILLGVWKKFAVADALAPLGHRCLLAFIFRACCRLGSSVPAGGEERTCWRHRR